MTTTTHLPTCLDRLLSIALTSLLATAAQAQSPAAVTLPPVWMGSHSVRLLPLDIAVGMGAGVIIGRKNNVGVALVDGQVFALRSKPGYANPQPSAISRNGQIVGTGQVGNQFRGLYWPSYASDPIDMGAPVQIMFPRGVNSSGVAVGEMIQPLPDGGETRTAFTWSLASGLRSIAPPFSTSSAAFAISDSGFAAGEAEFGTEVAAVRWSPGTTGAGVASYSSYARHVKENGTIYNEHWSWNLSNHPSTIVPSSRDLVSGISEPGRVVGTSLPTPQWPFRRAFTLGFGTPLKPLPLPPGATHTVATQVDDCGSVLGSAEFANGTSQAVFWSLSACDQTPTRR